VAGPGVKLLLDENLSFRLVARLADVYPGSAHVRDVGLSGADDGRVWEHARAHGFVIASRDADFHDRCVRHGPPPKLVWIQRGNCSTRDVEAILRRRSPDVERFAGDAEAAVLVLE
jgi:predicted nuclease of predicted toxin-antitoxin system